MVARWERSPVVIGLVVGIWIVALLRAL